MRGRALHVRRAILLAGTIVLVGCGATPVLPAATEVSVPSSPALTLDTVTVDDTPITLTPATDPSPTTDAPPVTTPAATWQDVTGDLAGKDSECGNVSIVAPSPHTAEEVAVIALHGAFAEQNGNAQWDALGTGAGSATITNRGMTIVYDPTNANTFWEAGAYHDGAVYRTDDGGKTFKQLGDLTHMEGLAVDFTDPTRSTLITTQHEATKIYRSTDGGATWTDISAGLPPATGFLSGPVILGPNSYQVGSNNDTGSGIFVTADGGMTWTNTHTGGVVGYPLTVAKDGITYMTGERGGVIGSLDGGKTWQTVAGQGDTSATPSAILQMADGRIVTLGQNNHIIATTDKGHTWSYVGPPVPFQPNGIAYSQPENAIYAWHADCDFAGKNTIKAGAIVRLVLAAS